jgi:hypothetical protein
MRLRRFEPSPASRRLNWQAQSAASRTLTTPKIAACLIRIFPNRDVKPFTRLRD